MSASIPSASDLPDALTTRNQWLCWRTQERDGKQTKVPVDPTSGAFASTTDADTWSDFTTARERATSTATDAVGVGFVFTDDDPLVGVDLDDCRIPETGKTREWATDIIDRLESFTEISPSGTGYHVLVEGSLPDGRNRRGDIELYETARFFTVTGDHVERTPSTIVPRGEALTAIHREYLTEESSDSETETDESEPEPSTAKSVPDKQLVDRAKNAANGDKFERLWRGNTGGYDSHSEADMALCSLLAFWTGGDATQLDRLFRDSGLMREKWDERHYADGSTYGEKTIERAIAGTDEFYAPPRSSSKPEPSSQTQHRSSEQNTQVTDERESEKLDRIEELETELKTALDTIDTLEAELAAERDKRRELESQLEAERQNESERGSWLPWR